MAETTVVSLTADRPTAERAFAALSEGLDPERTACALFETPAGAWTVAAHSDDALDHDSVGSLVAAAVGSDVAAKLVWATVTAADWVSASLAGLRPVTAGRFVVHGAHDRDRVPANRIGIEIEAALAFGTGHHGTTRGCLIVLDRLLKTRRPRRVLDVGTGTGVLAIAAARSLRRRVIASDVDAVAAATARANVSINRAAPWVRVIHAAGTNYPGVRRAGGYDLVFANILLGPLQRLAGPIARRTTPRARAVLSGLLPAHVNAAHAVYRAHGFVLERRLALDGWVSLVLRRVPRKASPRLAERGSGR